LGPYKVRITTKEPTPDAMMLLSFGSPIYPEHYHKTFENKEEFGTKPMGSGPYRIVSLDKNKGIVAERNQYFKSQPTKPAAAIKTVIAQPVEDNGTAVALMLAGEVDIFRNLPIEQ